MSARLGRRAWTPSPELTVVDLGIGTIANSRRPTRPLQRTSVRSHVSLPHVLRGRPKPLSWGRWADKLDSRGGCQVHAEPGRSSERDGCTPLRRLTPDTVQQNARLSTMRATEPIAWARCYLRVREAASTQRLKQSRPLTAVRQATRYIQDKAQQDCGSLTSRCSRRGLAASVLQLAPFCRRVLAAERQLR